MGVGKLTEENSSLISQVAGFEKAFRRMNDQRNAASGGAIPQSEQQSANGDDEVEEANIWSDADKEIEQVTELKRTVADLRNRGSSLEDTVENLRAELSEVKATKEQEIKSISAQKTALESQLIDINRSASAVRDSLPDSATTGESGGDPALVAQVALLESANKTLTCNLESLGSDMEEKLAPLIERISALEEEKRATG